MGRRNRRKIRRGVARGSRSLLTLGVSVREGGNVGTDEDREANKLLGHVDDPLVVEGEREASMARRQAGGQPEGENKDQRSDEQRDQHGEV